jgi:hypothetical protein
MKHFLLFMFLIGYLSACNMMRKASRPMAKKIMTPDRIYSTNDIQLPPGYHAELVAKGLTFPTAATFDDEGNLYVIEAGYSYEPEWEETRLIRINTDGSLTTIYKGDRNGPWNGIQFHQGNFYIAEGGHKNGDKILKVSKDGKNKQVLVEGLPSYGDHHTNAPVAKDGWIYFAQGPATNSGVVGRDNWKMVWPYYSGGVRLDDPSFVRTGVTLIKMLMQNHPGTPPQPVARLGIHSSSSGLAFAPNRFGFGGQASIACLVL